MPARCPAQCTNKQENAHAGRLDGYRRVVPAGLRHAYRNRGDETARMVCHARPPSTLQEFLEGAAALSRAGKLTRRAIPKSLGALLEGVALAHDHRETVVLLFPPMPPSAFLQRLLFPGLARLAKARARAT